MEQLDTFRVFLHVFHRIVSAFSYPVYIEFEAHMVDARMLHKQIVQRRSIDLTFEFEIMVVITEPDTVLIKITPAAALDP